MDQLVPLTAVEYAYRKLGFTRNDYTSDGHRYVEFQNGVELMFHPVVMDTDAVDLQDLLRDCGGYDDQLGRDMSAYLISYLRDEE